jgi:hypothetical protein
MIIFQIECKLKHLFVTCSNDKERVFFSQRYFAVLTMLNIYKRVQEKQKMAQILVFFLYLRLLYDQYCQLACYRLKPLRNSGVVHADGTGSWPAGELVFAVKFMSKFFFFFVCHVITQYVVCRECHSPTRLPLWALPEPRR